MSAFDAAALPSRFPDAASGSAAAGHCVGVCSWSLEPRSPGDLISALARLKINAVQLALSPMLREPTIWQDAITQVREAGIDILSGMMATVGEDYSTLQSIAATGGVRPDEHWPANLAHARGLADVAARHHINLVTFHAGFIPHDSTDHSRGRVLDRLGMIADIFHASGVSIAFETGQESALTLIDALDALARPNVGVNFDPANMILYGMGDPVESLRLLSPRVKQVHVKDAQPAARSGIWGCEVAAGAGAVDWPRFFGIARAIVPPVNFLIEREGGANREYDIAAARDLIAQHASHDGAGV